MASFDWQFNPEDPKNKGYYLRSRRGPIGANWWSRRWLSGLEAACDPSALEAGRRLARRSQVRTLEVEAGVICSRVEESRERVFKVTLQTPSIETDTWQQIMTFVCHDSLVVAQLYAGVLAEEMEERVQQGGSTLFPELGPNLSCTCCDAVRPCQHTVAMCCVIAERLDLDPFSLIEFRGLDRADFIDSVRLTWGAPPRKASHREMAPPLTADIDFYRSRKELPRDSATLQLPLISVMGSLGNPPFFPPNDQSMSQSVNDLYDD